MRKFLYALAITILVVLGCLLSDFLLLLFLVYITVQIVGLLL